MLNNFSYVTPFIPDDWNQECDISSTSTDTRKSKLTSIILYDYLELGKPKLQSHIEGC